jgi:hypothetical protein
MLVLALLEIIRYLSGLGSWTSLLSLRLCHVVHLRRKCYLPDTLRHLYKIGPFQGRVHWKDGSVSAAATD